MDLLWIIVVMFDKNKIFLLLQSFQDIDGLRSAFDTTQARLSEMKHSYIRRRDAMRQQVNYF